MLSFGRITPVLRIFDLCKAKEFYVDFLGFSIDFEHRHGENFPLYIGLSQSDCTLHLSEHHGDACPGAHIRILVGDIDGYSRMLALKDYKFAKPGTAEETPWQTRELTINDPFGNRLTFVQGK